ncbi:MAG: efflux RND transporter permease subunit [Kiritimatiellae bacterium]|nr:efflux RND transporter permease subunit [Kiritimatiellia bacterium]
MNLPEFGVKRPITNLMIFIGIIIISLYSITRLGVDLMPEIEPPSISVISTYSGASPEDVEIRVTEPLENQLASTPGVEKITSRSLEGVSAITLKFIWGINLDEASNDIRDRIDRAKRLLPDIPDEMDNPFIFKFNTAMMPIMHLGITADQSYPGLYDLIDRQVADPLRQIPGVGTVQLMGGLERQINVWIDRNRLDSYNLSILDVQNAILRENITQPVGNIKSGMTDYLVRLPGEFTDPGEVNAIILGRHEDRLVYMRDVARVEDGFKEVSRLSRINRHRGMALSVQKQTGVNTVKVAEKVKKKIRELERQMPPDVKFHLIMDSSEDIMYSINSLTGTLRLAALLVVFVTWFFLRKFRSSIIIALTIPFSILLAFTYLFMSNRTINVIGLTAMTIAIGMVVDNAVVIVDNITRHLERGERPAEAAIFGTREMFLSVAASTATTLVVFLPLLFVTGLVGIMFKELSAIICITLLASLFTATTFTPMICSRWLKRNRPREGALPPREKTRDGVLARLRGTVGRSHLGFASVVAGVYDISERWFTALENRYALILAWSLRRRRPVIASFALAFLSSLALLPFIGSEFIPEEDAGMLSVSAELPVGTRIEETDKTAGMIEDIIEKEVPEKIAFMIRFGQGGGIGAVFGGRSGSHVVSGGVKVTRKEKRKRSSMEITQAVREKLKNLPGVLRTDITTGNPLGRLISGTGGKSIQIEIIGHDLDQTDAAAARIKDIMEKTPGAVDVSVSRDRRKPELKIEIDREKAAALGLNMDTIADTLKTAIEGSTATKYRESGRTYDIYVRLEETCRSRPEDIENLMVVSPFTGKQIRMSNFTRVREITGPIEIERQNRERVVRVECNAHGRSTGEVVADLKKQTARVSLPAALTVNFAGDIEEQSKAFRDLALLLLLGIALVYMVMAAQFESLLDPFIIMFAVPFTFTGVILGFFVTGTTLSMITFLGLVMLIGIVVNNAIVLISYINILRARGFTMYAAVTEGGRLRLRPVMMTTLTTLAGMLPLALSRGQGSEIWQPLGITMVSGLSVTTFITMIFVPILYAILEEKVRKK